MRELYNLYKMTGDEKYIVDLYHMYGELAYLEIFAETKDLIMVKYFVIDFIDKAEYYIDQIYPFTEPVYLDMMYNYILRKMEYLNILYETPLSLYVLDGYFDNTESYTINFNDKVLLGLVTKLLERCNNELLDYSIKFISEAFSKAIRSRRYTLSMEILLDIDQNIPREKFQKENVLSPLETYLDHNSVSVLIENIRSEIEFSNAYGNDVEGRTANLDALYSDLKHIYDVVPHSRELEESTFDAIELTMESILNDFSIDELVVFLEVNEREIPFSFASLLSDTSYSTYGFPKISKNFIVKKYKDIREAMEEELQHGHKEEKYDRLLRKLLGYNTTKCLDTIVAYDLLAELNHNLIDELSFIDIPLDDIINVSMVINGYVEDAGV